MPSLVLSPDLLKTSLPLQVIRKNVFGIASPWLTLADCLLYRHGCLDGSVEDVLQLVVPESLRQIAWQTTHVLPGGGHFAAEKTLL